MSNSWESVMYARDGSEQLEGKDNCRYVVKRHHANSRLWVAKCNGELIGAGFGNKQLAKECCERFVK